jgi:hypothetical protein
VPGRYVYLSSLTVQQRQPKAVVKQAEGYHRRAGAVAGLASAWASKHSSASGGLGLATLRRTSVHLGITTLCRATRHKWIYKAQLNILQALQDTPGAQCICLAPTLAPFSVLARIYMRLSTTRGHYPWF